jgi:hypothetical protein
MPVTDTRPSSDLTEAELNARILQRELDIHNLANEIQKRLDGVQSDVGEYIFKLLNFIEGQEPTPGMLKALWAVVTQWRDEYEVSCPEDILDRKRTDIVQPNLQNLAWKALEIIGYWEDPQDPFKEANRAP